MQGSFCVSQPTGVTFLRFRVCVWTLSILSSRGPSTPTSTMFEISINAAARCALRLGNTWVPNACNRRPCLQPSFTPSGGGGHQHQIRATTLHLLSSTTRASHLHPLFAHLRASHFLAEILTYPPVGHPAQARNKRGRAGN